MCMTFDYLSFLNCNLSREITLAGITFSKYGKDGIERKESITVLGYSVRERDEGVLGMKENSFSDPVQQSFQ